LVAVSLSGASKMSVITSSQHGIIGDPFYAGAFTPYVILYLLVEIRNRTGALKRFGC